MSEDVNNEVGLSLCLPERTHWSFTLHKNSKMQVIFGVFYAKVVANPYRSAEAAPMLKIPAAVAVMSPADAPTLSCDCWGESCLGGVWQRDWSLFRVWLEEIPARYFLLDLRKGGQSQVISSEGGFKTLHWCWSKHWWRISRIDVSLLVSLLGERSVICSSEWPYLKSNRAYYCSFICLCLWTRCSLGACFCTVCSSCIFPSDLDSLVMERLWRASCWGFSGFSYLLTVLWSSASLYYSHASKKKTSIALFISTGGKNTLGHSGHNGT